MKPKKQIIGLVLALTAMGLAAIFLFAGSRFEFAASSSVEAVQEENDFCIEAVPEKIIRYGMVVDGLDMAQNQVKKNQRFMDLLSGYHVDPSLYRQMHYVPRSLFDFRKISAHKKYTVIAQCDSLRTARAVIYEPTPAEYIIFHLQDTLLVEVCQREIRTEERYVTGIIQSSLSETIESLGITHELTNRFVDIFAWQIDFQRLQVGDRFKIIYEEELVEGSPVGLHQINAIYFEHFGNPYYAFPYDQGDGLDYFDERGNSLRKALLKYPIEFSRISSRYSNNRFHPVAKVYRAHRGTDFAAPKGSPIRSVGDGIVVEAKYTSNNGNYVKIRHNATYTTQYLHMSRIATGIGPGAKVRQGQTIGFVGSTGLATGPHLCYRFWKNGVQVDALKVELPPSQPIRPESENDFQKVIYTMMGRLDAIPFQESELEVIASGR